MSDLTSTPERFSGPAKDSYQGLSLRGVITSIPDWTLAGAFLVTWMNPHALGDNTVQYYLLTMLLEFIIVHSTGFMGLVAFSRDAVYTRVRNTLALALLYSLFVGGFSLAFKIWWPLYAFWGLTLNRMLGIVVGDPPIGRERQYVQAGWALSAMYYLGGAFATLWLPIPALGFTPEAKAALDLPGSGVWIEEPQRALAFGVVYFALTGTGEVLGWARNQAFLKGIPEAAA